MSSQDHELRETIRALNSQLDAAHARGAALVVERDQAVVALREVHDMLARPGKHTTVKELLSCVVDSVACMQIDCGELSEDLHREETERNHAQTRATFYERESDNWQNYAHRADCDRTRLRRTVATLRARLRNRGKEWERDVGDWMRAERILVNTKDQLHDAMRSADRARVERDRLQERLDQFEAYGITVDSALRSRGEQERLQDELNAARERIAELEPALELADEAIAQAGLALALRTKGGAA